MSHEAPAPSPNDRVRLQKYLASCGLGSRRACEEFISAGRVTIDGVVAETLGVSVNPQEQVITLDGERLRRERRKYYMLHKPPGFLCTNHDPEGRPRVIDLFPASGPRLFTVGRLDEDSEGLLIVTNDGDLAQQLAHPKFQIFRTYQVQVAGNPTQETLEQLQQGMYFTEGKFRVRGIKTLKKQGKSTHLEIVLGEGQNREIRRLLARVGHKVMSLKRVAFGPLKLGSLSKGRSRELTREELESLQALLERITGEVSTLAPSRSRGKRSSRDTKSGSRTRGGSRPATGAGRSAGGGRQTGETRGRGGRPGAAGPGTGEKRPGTGRSVGGKSVGPTRSGTGSRGETGPRSQASGVGRKNGPSQTDRPAPARSARPTGPSDDDFIVRKTVSKSTDVPTGRPVRGKSARDSQSAGTGRTTGKGPRGAAEGPAKSGRSAAGRPASGRPGGAKTSGGPKGAGSKSSSSARSGGAAKSGRPKGSRGGASGSPSKSVAKDASRARQSGKPRRPGR